MRDPATRYSPRIFINRGGVGEVKMFPDPEGDWVPYDVYQDVCRELDRLLVDEEYEDIDPDGLDG